MTGADSVIARAILQKALDDAAERDKRYLKNLEAAVTNGVARAFRGR